jgi:hypothetical protein
LGVIGTDELRVCRNTAGSCKIRGHKKNKFVLGCAAAYCIPAKNQRSTGFPAAFKFPCLDESKMTIEVRKFVEKHGSDTSLTTREWESYVPQALMEFGIQERGVGEGIPEERSDDSDESQDDLSLGNIPSLMPWDDPYEAPEPGVDSTAEFGETILDRQEIIRELKRLADGLQKLGDQARKDSKDAMEYLWLSVREVADEVDRVNSQLIVLKGDVGDITPLSELHNIDDLAEGVVEALGRVDAGELEKMMETAVATLDTKVGDLTDLMGDIDEDHRGAASYSLSKANEMSRRIGLLEVSAGAPSHFGNTQGMSLTHNTVILDSFGDPVASMAELWRVVTELKASNTALVTHVSELTAEVALQGGVVLGNMTFTSEAQIMQLVMMECPSGEAFEIFTDVMSLPCFDSSYEPVAGWEKTTKFMAADGQYSTTARKVVVSYNQQHAFLYTDGKPAIAGTRIAAFKTTETWRGDGGLDGRRHEIERTLETAALVARTMIDEKLPGRGGKLREVALSMIDRTLAWFNTVHRHLDAELLQLSQLHISEDECLILLSEEIIIMFSMIHDIRKQRMEFTLKGKRVEYMVRCIWLTLQAHSVMDGFVKRGLKYNSAISAAFIRFLTKQTGQNVSTGIGSHIKVLQEALDKAVKMAKEAADAAKEATRVSKEASTRSNTASSAADKATSDIKAILAKNSTLKKP